MSKKQPSSKKDVDSRMQAEEKLRNLMNFKAGKIGTHTPSVVETPPEISPIEINFCTLLMKYGCATTAYSHIFPEAHTLTASQILDEVSRIMNKPAVQAHMKKAREYAAYEHSVTVKTQANKLQRVYEEAMASGKYAAAVSAVQLQSRLYGILAEGDSANNVSVNVIIDQLRAGRTRVMRTVEPDVNTQTLPMAHNATRLHTVLEGS